MESIFILVIVFGPMIVGAFALVGLPIHLGRVIVRMVRGSRWVAAHDGALIGSDEFFAWCEEKGENPSKYFI